MDVAARGDVADGGAAWLDLDSLALGDLLLAVRAGDSRRGTRGCGGAGRRTRRRTGARRRGGRGGHGRCRRPGGAHRCSCDDSPIEVQDRCDATAIQDSVLRGLVGTSASEGDHGLDDLTGRPGIGVRAPRGIHLNGGACGNHEAVTGRVVVVGPTRCRADHDVSRDSARAGDRLGRLGEREVAPGVDRRGRGGRRRGRRGRRGGGRRGAGRRRGGRDRGPAHLMDGVGMACAFGYHHVNAAAGVECESHVGARGVPCVFAVLDPHTSLVSVTVRGNPVAIGSGPGESDGDSVSSGVCGVVPFGTRKGGDAECCCEHPKGGQCDRHRVASRAAARVFVYHYVSLDNSILCVVALTTGKMGPNFVLEHPNWIDAGGSLVPMLDVSLSRS